MHSRRLGRSFLSVLTNHQSCFRLAATLSSRHAFSTKLNHEVQSSIPDFHNYTRGRWLINDALERQARYLSFNHKELCTIVLSKSPGANCIISTERKDGSNSRILIFSLDNGKNVVAKLPTYVAGPKRLTSSSEVATMEYVRCNTKTPVPKILAWNDDASNPVGNEYVIMEHAEGIELRQLWFGLDNTAQINCIQKITEKVAEMTRLEFSAYGSLYLRDSRTGEEGKVVIDGEFCIGSSCSKTYWDCAPGERRWYGSEAPDRGPYISAFVDDLINAGLSRISPFDGHDRRARRRHQGTVLEHRKLLHSTREVLHDILKDARVRDNAAPILVHPDLHMSNIFVDPDDPTKITSIIDWQSASIEPAFMCSLPILDFALSADYLAHIEETQQYREMTTPEIWDAALNACLHLVPRIDSLMETDIDLFRLFKTCHRTWRDGTPLLTSDLIDLADRWQALGLPGSCRYVPPTGEELTAHKEKWAWFEDFQRFRGGLSKKLQADNDSWIPAEQWDATQELHKEIFEGIIEQTKEPDADMTEEDWRAIWPYDTPDRTGS